MPGKELQ